MFYSRMLRKREWKLRSKDGAGDFKKREAEWERDIRLEVRMKTEEVRNLRRLKGDWSGLRRSLGVGIGKQAWEQVLLAQLKKAIRVVPWG